MQANNDKYLKLYKFLQRNEIGSLEDIISDSKDATYLYELSHIRENILSIVDFSGTENVLEYNASCGALTGYLCSKAEKVTAVEESDIKRDILRLRYNNADNLAVVTPDSIPDDKYDVVVLIGNVDSTSIDDFLEDAYSRLCDGGRLIFAVDNRYGMKYLNGSSNYGRREAFVDIEDKPGNVRTTFSKKELADKISIYSYQQVDFFYPYPDYRYTLEIYSDKWLPRKGELVNNLGNFDFVRLNIFDEQLAFDSVISDGMFDVFSNSYLLFCRK